MSKANKSQHVLHLVEYLYLGGIERLLEQISNFSENDSKLSFLSYESEKLEGIGKKIEDKGFPVYIYKKKQGRDWQLVREILKIIKKENITVIHTHDFGPMEYALMVKILRPYIKLIHTQHTIHHFIVNMKYRYFFQFASHFYKNVNCVSHFVKNIIKEKCLFVTRKLTCSTKWC